MLGGASTEPRDPGLVRRGLAGALRALERAVMAHSSPEPSAACAEGRVGRRLAGVLRTQREL